MSTATEVRERPVIFSGEMVNAILQGRKTQTRRVITPQPRNPETFGISPVWGQGLHGKGEHAGHFCLHAAFDVGGKREDRFVRCPYGVPGDRLWVRETWAIHELYGSPLYRADTPHLDRPQDAYNKPWSPSIYMPRWRSRLTLEVTEVRVQRLQEISDYDATAEGVNPFNDECRWCHGSGTVSSSIDITQPECPCRYEGAAKANYARLWDSLNAKRGHSWASNPWVWCISFSVSGSRAP